MKCPHCQKVMETVDVEYISYPEGYVLDSKTGKYRCEFQEIELDDDSFSLYCGECGHELEGEDLELFNMLIEEEKAWGL